MVNLQALLDATAPEWRAQLCRGSEELDAGQFVV